MRTMDPNGLRPHPSIVHFPRPVAGTERFSGLMVDVREFGIRHPIQVTEGHLVVDGETRRQVALALGLFEVPVEVVPDDQVATVVLRELALRRNLTKSQIAYLAYPSIREEYEAAQSRMRENGSRNLKNPNVSRECTKYTPGDSNGSNPPARLQELAAGLGVSRTLLIRAARIWEVFADPRPVGFQDGSEMTLREYFEPRILADEKPMCLGDAMKGIGYYRPMNPVLEGDGSRDEGTTPVRGTPRHLFVRTFDILKSRLRYWEDFGPEDKLVIQEEMIDQLEDAPEEFLARLMMACKEAAKRRVRH